MKDNQNKYLDKVVDILVSDTRKDDSDQEIIHFPFTALRLPNRHLSLLSFYLRRPIYVRHFTKYCKNTYGIDGDEIKYVLDKYKDMLIEKIK
jgi:hypothetical protein